MDSTEGYNERLFAKPGLRSYYHHARFNWAEKVVRARLGQGLKAIELGCFDARLLDHISPRVSQYVGVDANWEGGLDLARSKYGSDDRVTLLESVDPADLDRYPDRHFDLAVSLETLEHLPPDLLPAYLDQLQRLTSGHLLVSVPNELGPIFLAKHLLKRIRYGDSERYTVREAIAATFGQSSRIERREHKGFDYRDLVRDIGKRFDVVEVSGLPPVGLPAGLSPTVAILARSRQKAN